MPRNGNSGSAFTPAKISQIEKKSGLGFPFEGRQLLGDAAFSSGCIILMNRPFGGRLIQSFNRFRRPLPGFFQVVLFQSYPRFLNQRPGPTAVIPVARPFLDILSISFL
jgi:hypothetical protein